MLVTGDTLFGYTVLGVDLHGMNNDGQIAMEVRLDDGTSNWWSIVVATPAPPLDGDYNGDGSVDAADYVAWRKGFGTIYDESHYAAWRSNFARDKLVNSGRPSGHSPRAVAAAAGDVGRSGAAPAASDGVDGIDLLGGHATVGPPRVSTLRFQLTRRRRRHHQPATPFTGRPD